MDYKELADLSYRDEIPQTLTRLWEERTKINPVVIANKQRRLHALRWCAACVFGPSLAISAVLLYIFFLLPVHRPPITREEDIVIAGQSVATVAIVVCLVMGVLTNAVLRLLRPLKEEKQQAAQYGKDLGLLVEWVGGPLKRLRLNEHALRKVANGVLVGQAVTVVEAQRQTQECMRAGEEAAKIEHELEWREYLGQFHTMLRVLNRLSIAGLSDSPIFDEANKAIDAKKRAAAEGNISGEGGAAALSGTCA